MSETDWKVVRTDEHPVLDEKDCEIQRLKIQTEQRDEIINGLLHDLDCISRMRDLGSGEKLSIHDAVRIAQNAHQLGSNLWNKLEPSNDCEKYDTGKYGPGHDIY